MATLTAARVDAPLAALAGLCAAALAGVVLTVDGAVTVAPVHHDSTPIVAAVLAAAAAFINLPIREARLKVVAKPA